MHAHDHVGGERRAADGFAHARAVHKPPQPRPFRIADGLADDLLLHGIGNERVGSGELSDGPTVT